MKKLLSLILAVLMLAAMFPASALAADAPSITATADNSNPTKGDTVEVTFAIANNPGFAVATFGLNFDADKLSFKGLKTKTDEYGQTSIAGLLSGAVATESGSDITVAWASAANMTLNNTLFVAVFEALEPGDSEVSLAVKELKAANGTEYNDSVSSSAAAVTVGEPQNPIIGIEIRNENEKITTATDGSMTMAVVAGSDEVLDLSLTLENVEAPSTQVILWSSSNEEVATVSDGKVIAKSGGTAVITARAVDPSGIALLAEGEDVLAQVKVNVSDPAAGYTVTLPNEDVSTVCGKTITIPVTVGHTGEVKEYNAFDMSVAYDGDVLELLTESTEDMTVTPVDGGVQIRRFGDALTVGEAAFTLEFRAKTAAERSDVKLLTGASVDIAENAKFNAPAAQILDEDVRVTVDYAVKLPDGYAGAASVKPGEDYTFRTEDTDYQYWVYSFTGSKMGDADAVVVDNGDGSFTVKEVQGNLNIQAAKTGKEYSVTLPDNVMSGADKAYYGTAYTAELTADGSYEVAVQIGEQKYQGLTVSGKEYTISGEAIQGNIVFTATKKTVGENEWNVTFEGEAGAAAGNAGTVQKNGKYTFKLDKAAGYTYTVTYTMGDSTEQNTLTAGEDGNYTIENVTGDLVITIRKQADLSDLTVEVKEYVKLSEGENGKSLFLVKAAGTLPENMKAFAYDGEPMYFTETGEGEEAKAQWYWLIEVTGAAPDAGAAKASITAVAEAGKALVQTTNVNQSDKLDINDAQFVYNIYNTGYDSIDEIGMAKYLLADTNDDGKVDVNDATKVVNEIIGANA